MSYILIADDNPDITSILSLYAEKEGFQPVVAADGEEAVRLFNQYNPVVVLLDVMMPKMDGWQVCREIRKNSKVPIIMLTAKSDERDELMGFEGETGFLAEYLLPVMLILGNITFALFDIALTRIVTTYLRVWQKKFRKLLITDKFYGYR